MNEIIQYASLIHISSQNTLNLLDNLLNWARLQQSTTGFLLRRILLFEAVNESLLVPGQFANQKNITIKNKVSSAAIVHADEQMLSVLLRNLVCNAIKFTYSGSEVIIESSVIDGETHVSVIDQGVGIAPENIKNLFDITSSFSTRGTGNESGTGLGLTLCKDIIEKHQGSIWVKSTLKHGSTFSFSLPETTIE
jgi:two-component system, sensor histidine kinase and response regulator